MIQSQRHSVRLPVRTLVCNLDHWNEATILNVSEGGMALQAMAPVNMSRPVQVILDWAESSGSIEASGEVAWNDHGRAGVRFSSIGETSHDRLIEWLYQDVAARCVQTGESHRGSTSARSHVARARLGSRCRHAILQRQRLRGSGAGWTRQAALDRVAYCRAPACCPWTGIASASGSPGEACAVHHSCVWSRHCFGNQPVGGLHGEERSSGS